VTSPRPSPPPDEPARPVAAAAAGPQAVLVEDHLARRIRKPIDLMRCVASCIEIVLLAAIGVAAGAATAGIETDVVGASRRLPHALLMTARPVALFALLLLPVALAIRELVRRQPRRLAEAAGTAVLAVAVVAVANALLSHHTSSLLYHAIAVSGSGASHASPLDGYLAGLAAYTTMIGLSGQSRWQAAVWLTLGLYAVVNLAALQMTVLALLLALLTGRAIGLGVRYAAGTKSQRPAADRIAAALGGARCQLQEIRRVPAVGHESRRYAATARRGDRLDVCVYDRDQEAAGAIYRLYRSARLENQVSHSAPLSVDRAVERRALLSYATEEAGVLTPGLRALVRVGPEAMALAYEHHDGTTLAEQDPAPADAELGRVWDAVLQLHAHRVTHRALASDHILFTDGGQVMLLDPGNGDVAAGDLQLRLDVAQLITELALRVGPDRSADLALRKLGADEMVAVVPLLQPVVLYPSTRAAVRRRKDVLPALRQRLMDAAPGDEVPPVRLERIRPRTLLTLVASVVAVYLLAGELARASLGSALQSADWRWGIVALLLSALTYVGAALSLSGFVAERLNFVRTILAQLAGSFVTLVTPAAVGGVALNIRYLQRQKVPAAVAAASVAVSQVVAFVLHILLLVMFAALAGTAEGESIRPPTWVYFVLAGLVVIALVMLAIPAGRRLLRARLAPTFAQVAPRLLQVAQQPRKLAEGVGGTLLLSLSYITCLDVCIRALGGSAPFASVAVVYLTGSALGSIVPTPGGLGAVEAALTAGLRAAGVAGGVAISAVLLFRLLTFWLPVPAGWAALRYLERQQAL
jgi:glycosyltransferase 2 family protein